MLTLFNESWRDLWNTHDEGGTELGAVFTKPEIVALILDLAGYRVASTRLASRRLLEPSCGDGAFLTEIVARLLKSEELHGGEAGWEDPVLDTAIRAVDVDERSLEVARAAIGSQLIEAGCPEWRARGLAERWTVHTDFLLSDWSEPFDFVIGNPPYVRIEAIAPRLLRQYRSMFPTLISRADLYVAFIEKGLSLLGPDGVLAYICANRFAKNQYGAALRKLISRRFHVRYYLNLEHTQPFQAEVSAYPAILVVDREMGAVTQAAEICELSPGTLASVRSAPCTESGPSILSKFPSWYPDGGPWITTSAADHASWEELIASHPTLEESAEGTRVGIGVATGADKVFILPERRDDIEACRQIPLALSRDLSNDGIDWSGRYLLNPFADGTGSGLVDLREYPGLAAYLDEHREHLERRHVARSRPASWFRTIDRIWPSLQRRPKLLVPDIQRETTIGYDEGIYYPHHNLYWITSERWDLRALKAILRSTAVFDQVRAYSVQMRGGSIRFQAQTLRRVRVPRLALLPDSLQERLGAVAESADIQEIDELVTEAYRVA